MRHASQRPAGWFTLMRYSTHPDTNNATNFSMCSSMRASTVWRSTGQSKASGSAASKPEAALRSTRDADTDDVVAPLERVLQISSHGLSRV